MGRADKITPPKRGRQLQAGASRARPGWSNQIMLMGQAVSIDTMNMFARLILGRASSARVSSVMTFGSIMQIRPIEAAKCSPLS